jgi:hypothetical protein
MVYVLCSRQEDVTARDVLRSITDAICFFGVKISEIKVKSK